MVSYNYASTKHRNFLPIASTELEQQQRDADSGCGTHTWLLKEIVARNSKDELFSQNTTAITEKSFYPYRQRSRRPEILQNLVTMASAER